MVGHAVFSIDGNLAVVLLLALVPPALSGVVVLGELFYVVCIFRHADHGISSCPPRIVARYRLLITSFIILCFLGLCGRLLLLLGALLLLLDYFIDVGPALLRLSGEHRTGVVEELLLLYEWQSVGGVALGALVEVGGLSKVGRWRLDDCLSVRADAVLRLVGVVAVDKLAVVLLSCSHGVHRLRLGLHVEAWVVEATVASEDVALVGCLLLGHEVSVFIEGGRVP